MEVVGRYPGAEGNPRLWTELRRDFEEIVEGPEEWRRRDTQSFGNTWVDGQRYQKTRFEEI